MQEKQTFTVKRIFEGKVVPKTYRVEKNVEITMKKWQELYEKYDMDNILSVHRNEKMVISTSFLLDLINNPPEKKVKNSILAGIMFLGGGLIIGVLSTLVF